MNYYVFTLKFAVPSSADRQSLEECLFEAGCDDALIGLGQKGRLALHFDREATSAVEALTSALRDVKNAVPSARLVEVGPDLVGMSEVAELLNFTRQNMRKLVHTHLATFPLPVHEGRSSLWHLADVLDWFREYQDKPMNQALTDIAKVGMQVNLAKEVRRLDSQDNAWFEELAC